VPFRRTCYAREIKERRELFATARAYRAARNAASAGKVRQTQEREVPRDPVAEAVSATQR
jgi:hypothetical protein